MSTTITPAVLNEQEAAEYLGITKYWLRNNRRSPAAPPFCRLGGRIRYRVETLDRWLAAQEVVNG